MTVALVNVSRTVGAFALTAGCFIIGSGIGYLLFEVVNSLVGNIL